MNWLLYRIGNLNPATSAANSVTPLLLCRRCSFSTRSPPWIALQWLPQYWHLWMYRSATTVSKEHILFSSQQDDGKGKLPAKQKYNFYLSPDFPFHSSAYFLITNVELRNTNWANRLYRAVQCDIINPNKHYFLSFSIKVIKNKIIPNSQFVIRNQ